MNTGVGGGGLAWLWGARESSASVPISRASALPQSSMHCAENLDAKKTRVTSDFSLCWGEGAQRPHSAGWQTPGCVVGQR